MEESELLQSSRLLSELSRRDACKLGIATALTSAARMIAGSPSTFGANFGTGAYSAENSKSIINKTMLNKSTNNQLHVAVIGAGAFGGWTAFYLLRSGARVTLIDAWGPGNSRASSGGETRVIRGTYGPNQPYTQLAARAMELWREHQTQWRKKFFFPIGVLWMVEATGDFERGSLPSLKDASIRFEHLETSEMARRWPQINFEKIEWGIYEPESGYLLARASAQAVVEQFVAAGGEYRQAAIATEHNDAKNNKDDRNRSLLEEAGWKDLSLNDGSKLVADRYVFACGPWLGRLFPQTVGPHFVSTKQDVFFFGTPSGDARYNEGNTPVWADHSDHFMYGIPGNQGRGFKLADDTRGPEFDPTSGERLVSDDRLTEARRYLGYRFPGMKNAPLLETRVCQYENTTDHNFIIDRHPANANVWIVGGGSGHGFKHGPAIGEMVAQFVLKDTTADNVFRLARFAAPGPR